MWCVACGVWCVESPPDDVVMADAVPAVAAKPAELSSCRLRAQHTLTEDQADQEQVLFSAHARRRRPGRCRPT